MRLFRHWLSALVAASTAYAHSRSRDPLNYLSLLENPQIHTPSRRVHAHSSFDLTFDLHNNAQQTRLSLRPNHDILNEDTEVQYVAQDGTIRHVEKINRQEYRVFQGESFTVDEDGISQHVGWARIVVRRDGVSPIFEGAFTIMGDSHHIQMRSNYMSTKHVMDPQLEFADDEYMVVWRDSDISQLSRTDLSKRSEAGHSCSSDKLPFNNDLQHPIFRDLLKRNEGQWGFSRIDSLLGKRQSIDGGGAGNGNSAGVNLRNSIGSTAGCPSQRKVALMGVATDCSYHSDFNSTDSVRQNVINVVNTASDLYQATFNITLGLRTLTILDAGCPGTPSTATPWNVDCSSSTSITQRLNLFSAWRTSQNDSNAYWSLFTKCNTDTEVGLAWLGQLCVQGGTTQKDTSGNTQTVTGANVVARTSLEWQVFAHETGHTFGAVHDCDSQTCASSSTVSASQCCPVSATGCDAQAQYLMNPYSASGITKFSPCSVGNICSALGRNSVNSACLSDNREVTTVTGPRCGNGIVEEGEDCDCGGSQACAGNSCCNPTTCKFTTGSVCDPSNEGCCTSQCQFASAGTVCRASSGQCDPQETCSGGNGTCPADKTEPDGTNCGSGLQCASGQCTSRNQQCKTAMGSYNTGNDTYACNAETCTITCGSPSFGLNVCYSLQQNFLDGTPCGGGGHCSNGVCANNNVVKGWIEENRTLVIALASAIGGLLLFGILGCCIRACRRPRGKRLPTGVTRRGRSTQPPPNMGWDGPAVPPQMEQRGYGSPNMQYYPQQPPPIYTNPQGFPQQSVRYA